LSTFLNRLLVQLAIEVILALTGLITVIIDLFASLADFESAAHAPTAALASAFMHAILIGFARYCTVYPNCTFVTLAALRLTLRIGRARLITVPKLLSLLVWILFFLFIGQKISDVCQDERGAFWGSPMSQMVSRHRRRRRCRWHLF